MQRLFYSATCSGSNSTFSQILRIRFSIPCFVIPGTLWVFDGHFKLMYSFHGSILRAVACLGCTITALGRTSEIQMLSQVQSLNFQTHLCRGMDSFMMAGSSWTSLKEKTGSCANEVACGRLNGRGTPHRRDGWNHRPRWIGLSYIYRYLGSSSSVHWASCASSSYAWWVSLNARSCHETAVISKAIKSFAPPHVPIVPCKNLKLNSSVGTRQCITRPHGFDCSNLPCLSELCTRRCLDAGLASSTHWSLYY